MKPSILTQTLGHHGLAELCYEGFIFMFLKFLRREKVNAVNQALVLKASTYNQTHNFCSLSLAKPSHVA
jgi:hypothetical protein